MNKEKLLYERALITCMVMLFVCIVLKIFGVEWFNLDASIPLLNKIDEIVMNSEVLSFLYSFALTFMNSYLIAILMTNGDKLNLPILSLGVFISLLLTRYYPNSLISFLYDCSFLYVVCNYKNKVSIKRYVAVSLLNIVYQIISVYLRNVGFSLAYRGVVETILLNIDYYIMLIITCLVMKKGDFTCGIKVHFGSSLRTKLWKKHLQSSNPCSDKG